MSYLVISYWEVWAWVLMKDIMHDLGSQKA